MFMLKNILNNLLRKSSTRLYPAEVRPNFPAARGRLWNEIEKCIFCSSCSKTCPASAITVNPEDGTWTYDPFACVYCSVCVDKCPTKCLHMDTAYRKPAPQKFMVVKKGTPKPKKAKPAEDAPKASAKK